MKRYANKIVNNSYYGTLGIGGYSRRISVIKRRNKLRKIYDLDSKIEDETQGIIYAPYIPIQRPSIIMSADPGIEPCYPQVYIRRTKKSEN